ncbi:secreted subtilisin-like serine protease [Phycomyces blakesleeanus]|uniref:Secreted subtilisin-like serine protease n=1 Tax=Phycomyces blakesleeanus TaxID=4837 RepID=A0ABR3B854_PHYBL
MLQFYCLVLLVSSFYISPAICQNAYVVELSSKEALTHFNAQYNTRYTYDSDLLRGVSVQFGSTDEASIALAHPDIKNIWPITHKSRPTSTSTINININNNNNNNDNYPLLQTFDKDAPAMLTKANNAYRTLGQNGSGIKIGVIDSGIDYTHPALGGCFGKGCKVAYGYDLVGDDYNGRPESIKESHDPIDSCTSNSTSATGHGTFVSGIIAADDKKYNWTGVAPGATLGMWRVFGCNYGGVSNDILIKAMEMAYNDGMDIINISLGDNGGWEEDALSVVADRLVDLGVHVVAASGNIGTSGIFLTAAPATGRNVISVASTSNNYSPAFMINIESPNSKFSIPYRTFVNQPVSFNQTFRITAASTKFNPTFDACRRKDLPRHIYGGIVLIRQGGCSSLLKVSNARHAGAQVVLFYTGTTGTTNFEVLKEATLPVAFINLSDGKQVFDAISHENSRLFFHRSYAQFTKLMVALPADKSSVDQIASFSSLGPTNELQLKPELTAVGGNVFSTMPIYKNGYGFMSGTSMSAPFVAGSVALLLNGLEKRPSPGEAKTLLMNFANPTQPPIANLAQYEDSPIRQGAGLVNVVQAIEGYRTFHVSPAKFSFNDTQHFNNHQVLTLHNHKSTPLKVKLSHSPSLTATGYDLTNPSSYVPTEPIGLSVSGQSSVASVSFEATTLTIPPNSSKSVKISLTPPSIFNPQSHVIYGGFFKVDSEDDQISATVPYIGMVGNMGSLPILQRTENSEPFPFPSIGNPNGTILQRHSLGHYDVTPGSTNLPFILVRLLTGTAIVQLQVVQVDYDDAKNDKVIGDIPMETGSSGINTRVWLQRNTLQLTESSTAYHSWQWNGVYLPKPDATISGHNDPDVKPKLVEPGVYRIRVRALNVFGNRQNTSDWDTWTSPNLKLHRFSHLLPSLILS